MDQTSPEQKNDIAPEDIDQLIAMEDPSFAGELDALARESDLGGEDLAGLSADPDYDMDGEPEMETSEKEAASADHPLGRVWQVISKKLSETKKRVQLAGIAIKNRLLVLGQRSKKFLMHGLPERIGYLWSQFKFLLGELVKTYHRFAGLSLFQKSALFGSLTLAVAAVFFLTLTLRDQWLSRFVPELPRSLASAGEIIGKVKSKQDLMSFEAAFPDKEFQVQLPKLIVNLKPDSKSGSLPMGAFEFYLGLDTQDTAVEVRDREKEVIDHVQRAVETMTYSQVMSTNGKAIMKNRIRDSLNLMLNRGRVTGVYISTMVTHH